MSRRSEVERAVLPLLTEAQRLGFLGPGPVGAHVAHAWPLVDALPSTGLIVDLGSGGGVPSLVLITALPETTWVLVESHRRRATFLRTAVADLDAMARVRVEHRRAEEAGRGELRGTAVAVTARSFAPPAVTAECAAPFLRVNRLTWVAEPPPGGEERWPVSGLDQLGLERNGSIDGWTALHAVRPCPDRYPRRVGVPEKRPLF